MSNIINNKLYKKVDKIRKIKEIEREERENEENTDPGLFYLMLFFFVAGLIYTGYLGIRMHSGI